MRLLPKYISMPICCVEDLGVDALLEPKQNNLPLDALLKPKQKNLPLDASLEPKERYLLSPFGANMLSDSSVMEGNNYSFKKSVIQTIPGRI